jgi:hypothetical protein
MSYIIPQTEHEKIALIEYEYSKASAIHDLEAALV